MYGNLNTSDSNNESSSENSELKQDCLKNSCKNACLEIGNGTSKVRNSENICLDEVLMMRRFLHCRKDLILCQHATIYIKLKLKWNWKAFVRMLCLKWHFRNENKDIQRYMFKPKSKVNPRNKDADIQLYFSSLKEKLMKVEVSNSD